jgi:phospholipid/cholesterol/gamma-HCH transport system substrate-binding protein
VRDLLVANKPLQENVLGLQTIFLLYPYLLEGSFSVIEPEVKGGKETGEYQANFGLVLSDSTPTCSFAQNGGEASGYRERRGEPAISDMEFRTDVDCKVKDNKIARQASKTVLRRSAAGTVTHEGPTATGKDSWKWLLSDPVNR